MTATLADLSACELDIQEIWSHFSEETKNEISVETLEKYLRVFNPDPYYFLYEVYDASQKDLEALQKNLMELAPMRDWITTSPEKEFAQRSYEKKLEKPIGVIKNMYTCKACGCDEFFMDEKQTRGGDEGATLFVKCGNCGKRFKA